MNWLAQFGWRMRTGSGGKHLHQELEQELRFHVEKQTEANVARGMAPEEARRQALVALGGLDQTREQYRDALGLRLLRDFAQDLRYALRQMRRSPGFAAVVVLTLALGIGANTAIFSAVNALLLNPYPFPESNRIVAVEAYHISGKSSGTGYRDFLDWREQNAVFEEMAIVPWTFWFTLTGQGEPQRLLAGKATAGFLKVLGVQPFLGRFFTTEEDSPGGALVAVLSYSAWLQQFGGRADILGRVVTLNARPYTIIGVMPSRFAFPGIWSCELWMPLQENPANSRHQHQYGAMARLKPGINVARAEADMTAIARRLEQQYPDTNKGWRVAVMPMARALSPAIRTAVTTLFSAVVFVLLLACANVAALLLARASGRAKEVAVRTAVGASRARIVRQMLTESVLLALIGGALGLVFAHWLIGVTRTVAPGELGLDAALRLDRAMLGFTLAISLLAGMVFGLAPALYGSRTDLSMALKGGSRAGSGARSRSRFLSVLAAGEVALSLVLLVGAALAAKDFLVLLRVDTGIRTEHVLTLALNLPRERYANSQQTSGFYRDLLERLRELPGIQAAAAVSSLPMGGGYSGNPFEIEGRPKPADSMDMHAQSNTITPAYFRAMGIALLRGRDFDERDTASSLPVVIINDRLAREFFPNEDPIGRRIKVGSWRTIVGVGGAVKHNGPARQTEPQMYWPHAQEPSRSMSVVVRTAGDPTKLASAVRGIVRGLDSELPVLKLRTMRQVVFDWLSGQRLMALLLAAFSAFALALAVIGVYGVIAYSVAQRTQEMGVRMALGASPGYVLALVLREGALLAVAGVLIGVPAALAAARLLGSLLYGVSPRDVTVFTVAPMVLLLVALAASYVPARRAAKVDPVVALRYE